MIFIFIFRNTINARINPYQIIYSKITQQYALFYAFFDYFNNLMIYYIEHVMREMKLINEVF